MFKRVKEIVCIVKEQIIFNLPTELEGLHLSAMPAAKGHIFLVDISVISFYLSEQSALGNRAACSPRCSP